MSEPKNKSKVITHPASKGDGNVFDKLKELFDAQKDILPVPDEFYEILEKDRKKYQDGELDTESFSD